MNDFTRSLMKIAIPVTIQSTLTASFSIIDQLMIGQLGETSISAVGLGGNYTLIFSVIINAVGSVAGILIAQFLGAKDYKEAWAGFSVSGMLCMIISLLFMTTSILFTGQILGLYTDDRNIILEGTNYFRLIAVSYVPMGLSIVISTWLRCKEHASIPLVASFVAVLLNTGLNYILIFGRFGFKAYGATGAGIASLISQIGNLLFVVIGFAISLKKDNEHFIFSMHLTKLSKKDYLIMIAPLLISEFLWSLGQNVESSVYGHLGTEDLAAYVLTCPIQGLLIGALSGLSAAAGVMIGKDLGRKAYEQAYCDSKKLLYTGLIGSVILAAFLILLSDFYVSLYRVDGIVKNLGQWILIVFAIYAPVKVENMVIAGGIIKSGGNTTILMIIDVIGTWLVGVPLCLIAAYVFHLNIVFVYAILTFEEVVRFIIAYVVFKHKKWMISLG